MNFISSCLLLLAFTASSADLTVEKSCPEKAVKTVGNKYFRVRNDTCFLFMTYDKVVYETASDKCKSNGGTLAMPKTKDVNDFLIKEMRSFDRPWQPMWIGMNDKDVEGKIVWEDGTDVNAWGNFDWANGKFFGLAEDCFALDPNNEKWHDHGCSNTGLLTIVRITGNAQLPFICQYPVRKEQDAVDQIDQGDRAGQGDQGDKADQGAQGDKAGQGDQGDKAGQGAQGDKAGQGDQGDKAGHGAQGDKAGQGDQGDKAGQGDQGDKAGQGAQGDKAGQGAQGDKAGQGDQGVKAGQGDQGDKADQGDQGVKADQGGQRDRDQDSVDDSQDDIIDDDNCPQFNCPYKDCGMNGFKMDKGCQICECED